MPLRRAEAIYGVREEVWIGGEEDALVGLVLEHDDDLGRHAHRHLAGLEVEGEMDAALDGIEVQGCLHLSLEER